MLPSIKNSPVIAPASRRRRAVTPSWACRGEITAARAISSAAVWFHGRFEFLWFFIIIIWGGHVVHDGRGSGRELTGSGMIERGAARGGEGRTAARRDWPSLREKTLAPRTAPTQKYLALPPAIRCAQIQCRFARDSPTPDPRPSLREKQSARPT
ncbi:hypothetical protein C8F04DRAFT_1270519 [Mycena alexandri]|uniref:Uncharacterized protein n=1 Tax=Mycena alexandri TaxID=1745969 RepID=A0AAD6SEY8_9AGAR|nr:hypothetical protein C8F04DRAFT_1270519 [Mycena alexandri]